MGDASGAERPFLLRGRAFPIVDSEGRPIDDIDTDQIYHNAHLAVTDRAEMGRYAFGNLEGYKDFPSRVRPGDIVVVGRNFGCGSSRQHAVDCLLALGVGALLGESFGAIYFRNAINAGLPIVRLPDVLRRAASGAPGAVRLGDVLRIDLERGSVGNETTGEVLPGAIPPSAVQLEIYRAGGLFRFGKRLAAGRPG